MSIASAIARQGFRRWYERELIRGHGHLVLLLLSAVAALAAVEVYGSLGGSDRLLMVLCLATAAVVGAWSLRRYLYHLGLAEALADQAVCPHCRSYARWAVEAASTEPPAAVLEVRCRACGGRWQIRC